MHRIATGLAEAHEVHLVDGGFAIPRPRTKLEPLPLRLPRIDRSTIDQSLLAARAEVLADAVRTLRPDVMIVDHYPFSKWELEREIVRAIQAARAVRPQVKVVCSLRDLAPSTRQPGVEESAYAPRVLERLGEWFDLLLVHTDPRFNRLEDQFERATDIPVPVDLTGFVCGPRVPLRREPVPRAVLSGGGLEATPFLVAAIDAFRQVAASGALADMRLAVFPEPRIDARDRAALERAAAGGPVDVHEFSAEYDGWLQGAALAIGRAGYNTVADGLSAGVPAVFVPDPRVPDQRLRATLLARHGVGVVVDGADECDTGVLASAIERALAGAPVEHSFDMGGVATTRRIVTELAS